MFFNTAASLSNLSGTTSTQVDTLTQSCSEEPPNLQEPEEEEQADNGACDGEVEASQVRFDRKNQHCSNQAFTIYTVKLHPSEFI